MNKCPACSNALTEIKAGDILVDVCKGGCGGVWFDEFELKKFDEPHEFDGKIIIETAKRPDAAVDSNQIRYCPKCSEEELCRRYYDVGEQVEVDQCLHCSGIWLDANELERIRSQFKTEAERQKAGDAYLSGKLTVTQDALREHTKEALAEWDEETSLVGTLKALFRGLGMY